jgi:hypothetical protein
MRRCAARVYTKTPTYLAYRGHQGHHLGTYLRSINRVPKNKFFKLHKWVLPRYYYREWLSLYANSTVTNCPTTSFKGPPHWFHQFYSSSIVPGGLLTTSAFRSWIKKNSPIYSLQLENAYLVRSYTTLQTPATSLMIRVAISARKPESKGYGFAVIKS